MCTHQSKIFNKFTGQSLYVPCGHCKSCLQEKAAKMADRLRCVSDDYKRYFLTLTYKNEFLPYVLRSDFLASNSGGVIPVYRDGKVDRKRVKGRTVTGSYRYRNVFIPEPDTVIDNVLYDPGFLDDRLFSISQFHKLRHPTRHRVKDAVSVIYYRDVQLFVKRFKECVTRVLGKDCSNETNRFFVCSEYGTKGRAHFHILVDSKNLSLQDVKFAMLKSWPYADFRKLKDYCEQALDVSGYVASYVNCVSSVSRFLSESPFRPKHSFSKGLGLDSPALDCSTLFKQVDSGSFYYPVRHVKNGVPSVNYYCVPSYVFDRFFPKFKGSYTLSRSEMFRFLSRLEDPPKELVRSYVRERKCQNLTFLGTRVGSDGCFTTTRIINQDDFKTTRSKLLNAFWRVNEYMLSFGRSDYSWKDYCYDYIKFSVARSRSVLKRFYMNKDCIPQLHCYDNIMQLVDGTVSNDSLFKLIDTDTQVIVDPNEFPHVVNRTKKMEFMFDRYDKFRKVTNQAMINNGHDV